MRNRKLTGVSLLLLFAVVSAEAQWLRTPRSRAFSMSNAVAADPSGNVYTAGVFSCIVSFDGDSLMNNTCGEITPPAPEPENSQTDAFLAKRDESGELLWVLQFSGSPANKLFVNDVTVDPFGNAYVTGAYTGSLDFLIETRNNPDPTTEYFLVKVLADGNVDWVQSDPLDEFSESAAQKVAATEDGVYITGMVRDDFQFGGIADSVGRDASFVTSFDFSGTHRWTRNHREKNANGMSRGKVLEARGDNIWVFSSFRDTVYVDGTMVRPPGTDPTIEAGLICLYDASGGLRHFTLANTPHVEGIAFHESDDALYITGRAEGVTGIGKDSLFEDAATRAFVSKHAADVDAGLEWVVPLTGGSAVLTGYDVKVTSTGHVVAGGVFDGPSINSPTHTVPGGGSSNAFVLKLDANGNDLWLQSLGGTGDDALTSLAALTDDRLYGSGYYGNYLRVAGDELYTEARNGFTARLDICPAVVADMITVDSVYICDRSSAIFSVSNDPGYTYQWYRDNNPVSGATEANLEVTQEGVYKTEITGSGCTKFSPVAKLFVRALPDSVVLTNDALDRCEGESVHLAGPLGSYTFQWYDGNTPMAVTTKDIDVTADGDYHLEITDEFGCSILSDVFSIRFHPWPSDALTPPPGKYSLCSGNTFLLQADNTQGGMTWQWKRDNLSLDGATDANLEVTESGIYQAVITNMAGCQTVTQPDTVVVQASPIANLNDEHLPNDICVGESLRLLTPLVIGQTYQWFRDGVAVTGATTNALEVNEGGEYIVRANNTLCESFSETFTLAVHSLPDAIIDNDAPAAVCEGDPHVLEARRDVDYSYRWLRNGQLLGDATSPDLPVMATGDYQLQVTNAHECVDVSTATTITVNPLPPATVTATGPVVFCEGESVVLQGNAGSSLSYQWIKDGTPLGGAASRAHTVGESGAYQVRVTNSNQCEAVSAPIDVEAVAWPLATLVSSTGEHTICEHTSLELLAGADPDYDFTWMFNGSVLDGESSASYRAERAGEYRVVAANRLCRDTSSVLNLTVKPNPIPVVTRNGAFLSIALFGDIQWYRNDEPVAGANLQSIQVADDGQYHVRVVNADGCTAESVVVPMCLPVPEVERTNAVLRVSSAGTSYAWHYEGELVAGATQRQLTAQQSGNYSVVVVSDDGCVMETAAITVCIPYPEIFVDEHTGVLQAFPHPATAYQWYYDDQPVADGNTQVHIPDLPGVYKVKVTDLEGCASFSEPWTVTPVTGVDTEGTPLIQFYPNPAKRTLVVAAGVDKPMTLVLLDALGRQVLEQDVPPGASEIDVRMLSPGVYTIAVITTGGTTMWKFVKE